MAKNHDENERAQDDLSDEMNKIGLTPDLPTVTDGEDEDEDKDASGSEKEGEDESSDESTEEKDEDESEQEEAESDESKDEDEDGESDEADDNESDEDDKSNKGKFIPEYKVKRRQAKWETEKNSLLGTISKLQEDFESFKKQHPAPTTSKIVEKAKALGLDEAAIKNLQVLAEAIKEDIQESGGKITPEIQKEIEGLKSKVSKYEEQDNIAADARYFNSKWSGHVSTIEKEFPNITAKQLEDARNLMDKIWHTPKWADKDIDYVFFKNRDAFDAIISPRKKGLETGRTQGTTSPRGKKLTLSDNPSDSEIKEMDKTLADIASSEEALKPVAHTGI